VKRTTFFSVISLALSGIASGQAEEPNSQTPPQEFAPYGAVAIPPVHGTWEVITPGEALMGGYAPQSSGSSQPKQ
jgi:hypothetical protein